MRKEVSLTACLLALVFACAAPFAAPARAQAGGEPEVVASPEESFVLYQNERGETVCRPATPEERARLRPAAATRVIYRGAPLRRRVTEYGYEVLEPNSAADPSGLPLLPSAGLTIVLQGTAQLEANPTAKNAFIAAANRWESIISTPITITLSVDFGPQFFGNDYGSTNILGQTSSLGFNSPVNTVRGRLISNSSPTPSELQLYNALPSGSVPAEYNGTTVNVSNVRVSTALGRALGYNVTTTNPDARIGFNSTFGGGGGQFDFDPSDGITADYTDFDSVVVHEIGHALGFSSNNGGTDSSVMTVWDLFRFRPAASFGDFTTQPRVLTKGGAQVQVGGFLSTFAQPELNLSTGGPNPPEGDTDDGRQSSHWKADELMQGRPYIGIMDPTISRGLRRTISENDIRTIDLLGYSVAFAPARPANDQFAGAATLAGAAGAVAGANAWATREAGEYLHAGFLGDKSVWYNWTAPTTGTATFDTAGSGFNTTLAVYNAPAVNAVNVVASNNDGAGLSGGASRVTFNTTAGTLYRIAVDGWNGENGEVRLSWSSSGTTPAPVPTPTPAPTPAPSANPIDQTPFFVAQHYRDFLGREADQAGLSFWTGEIEQCGPDLACRAVKRVNVSAAFFESIEFQNTGYLVERMYKAAYGDRIEASTGLVVPVVTRAEFQQDTPLIGSDVVVGLGAWQAKLEANKVAYAQTFVQRPRFTDIYGALSPAQFVERLNQNAGAVLTPAEQASLAGELAANNTAAGRASVLRKVAEHAELDRREKNRAFVLMQYFGYLRRNPSDAPEANLNYAGWNFWLGKLNEFGGNYVAAEMVKAFLDSAEYRQRFAQ